MGGRGCHLRHLYHHLFAAMLKNVTLDRPFGRSTSKHDGSDEMSVWYARRKPFPSRRLLARALPPRPVETKYSLLTQCFNRDGSPKVSHEQETPTGHRAEQRYAATALGMQISSYPSNNTHPAIVHTPHMVKSLGPYTAPKPLFSSYILFCGQHVVLFKASSLCLKTKTLPPEKHIADFGRNFSATERARTRA